MTIDWGTLSEGNASVEPGDVTQALSWAEHLTDEEVNELHAKFMAIVQADDKKKAIIENVLFILQLGKLILLRV